MGGIAVGRWLVSGVVAGVFIWLMESAASVFYVEEMQRSLEAHGLAMELGARTWLVTVGLSVIAGLVIMFFYAAARPRLGPGPATAVKVSVALWLGGYLFLIGSLWIVGLYSPRVLTALAAAGLVKLVVAGLIGGILYRERAS